jgi:putative peptidoglycan lipid II flippase
MSKHLKHMAGMTLGTLFSRITGFMKWAFLGAVLGFTPIADAYNLAHILPTMIYELILGGILSAVFIPVVVEQLASDDRESAWKNISQITNAALIALGVTTLACWIASPLLVTIQTLKVSPEVRRQVMFFFLFFVPQIFLYGLSALAGGVLNARDRFTVVAFAPVVNNMVVIAALSAYRWLPGFGTAGLAVGTTLGVLAQAAVQYPSLKKAGWRYYPSVDFKNPAVVKIVKLSLPVLAYVIFNQLNLTVQNNLAIGIKGGVSSLQYAFAFYVLPHGLFAVSIGTVLLPGLSEMAVKNNWPDFASTVEKGIIWSAMVIIPAMAIYSAMSFPVVQVLMQRGRFTQGDTQLMSTVLCYYSFGLFSFTLYLFLNRVFYSLQDTITPLILNFIGNASNTVINLALIGIMGIPGLALGHAAAYTIIAGLSLWLIKKRLCDIDLKRILSSGWRIFAASLIAAGVAFFMNRFWLSSMGSLGLWAKAGILAVLISLLAAVYIVAAKMLGLSEMGNMIATVKARVAPAKYS